MNLSFRRMSAAKVARALAVLVVLGIAAYIFWPMWYSARSIEGWAVDAESKRPLPDVVVMAHWEVEAPLNGAVLGQINILETVTDENGHFFLPAWGPRFNWNPFATMWNRDPAIYLFKRGYRLTMVMNQYTTGDEHQRRSTRTSEWNGKAIELTYLGSETDAYVKDFDGTSFGIRLIADRGITCNWKEMPLLLSRLDDERRRLTALGFAPNLPNPARFPQYFFCGSADAWLREHSK